MGEPLTEPRILELAGLPGSGKSTVAAAVAAALAALGARVERAVGRRAARREDRAGRLLHLLRLSAPRPELGLRAGLLGLRGGGLPRTRVLLERLDYLRAPGAPADLLLWDEGPVQAALSLCLHPGGERLAPAAIELLRAALPPERHHLVVLRVTPDEAAARLALRPGAGRRGRFDAPPTPASRAALESGAAALERLAAARGALCVPAGAGALEAAVAEVVARARTLLGPLASPRVRWAGGVSPDACAGGPNRR